ncbi:MAG: NAD(P) transhydrogenase subunit alpha, partial [Myxococcales bacterium]|nr:NAD(P) transhydrogenase subunit alpha [Myxococcales bacterium]
RGGNCELTVPDERVEHNGVVILGYTDLPSRLATTASTLYGNNLVHLIKDMGGAEGWKVDLDDVVVRGSLVTHQGEITWPPPKIENPSPPPPKAVEAPVKAAAAKAPAKKKSGTRSAAVGIVLALAWLGARFGMEGSADPATLGFLQHLTVFALAVFVGWQVIWSVTAALHTPLMSVTNAISGIIIVGGMFQLRSGASAASMGLAVVAVLLAMINVAGGFLVTQRMLKMFRRDAG